MQNKENKKMKVKFSHMPLSTAKNQFIETFTKPSIILEFANRDFYIFNTKDKKEKMS